MVLSPTLSLAADFVVDELKSDAKEIRLLSDTLDGKHWVRGDVSGSMSREDLDNNQISRVRWNGSLRNLKLDGVSLGDDSTLRYLVYKDANENRIGFFSIIQTYQEAATYELIEDAGSDTGMRVVEPVGIAVFHFDLPDFDRTEVKCSKLPKLNRSLLKRGKCYWFNARSSGTRYFFRR